MLSLLDQHNLNPEKKELLEKIINSEITEAKSKLKGMLDLVFNNSLERYEALFFFRDAAALLTDLAIVSKDQETLNYCSDQLQKLLQAHIEQETINAYDTDHEDYVGNTIAERLAADARRELIKKPNLLKLREDQLGSVRTRCQTAINNGADPELFVETYIKNINFYKTLHAKVRTALNNQANKYQTEHLRLEETIKDLERPRDLTDPSEDEQLTFMKRFLVTILETQDFERSVERAERESDIRKIAANYFFDIEFNSIDLSSYFDLVSHIILPLVTELSDNQADLLIKRINELKLDIIGNHIEDHKLKKRVSSGVWGTTYQAEHAGHLYIIKVPNKDVDLSVKGHKKVVNHFGKGHLDLALQKLMIAEAEAAAFLSDGDNPALKLEKGKYIPIAEFHDQRTIRGLGIINRYTHLSGKTLEQIFKEEGKLNLDKFFDIMPELAFAIKFMHQNGYSHNDLKPDQIFYNDRLGQVKLIDFAFAKSNLYVGSLIGKRSYSDPARLCGMHSRADLSDIYAFGVIMYEAITGEMPVDFGNTPEEKEQIELKVSNGEIIPGDVKKLRKAISPQLELWYRNDKDVEQQTNHMIKMIMTCLDPDPAKRFQTMQSVEKYILSLKEDFDDGPPEL